MFLFLFLLSTWNPDQAKCSKPQEKLPLLCHPFPGGCVQLPSTPTRAVKNVTLLIKGQSMWSAKSDVYLSDDDATKVCVWNQPGVSFNVVHIPMEKNVEVTILQKNDPLHPGYAVVERDLHEDDKESAFLMKHGRTGRSGMRGLVQLKDLEENESQFSALLKIDASTYEFSVERDSASQFKYVDITSKPGSEIVYIVFRESEDTRKISCFKYPNFLYILTYICSFFILIF